MSELRRRWPCENPEEMRDYTNSEMSALIDEHIHSERDRKIMKRRLCDGICYEPLAAEFDMSVTQIKRITYKSQAKLLKYLT